MAAPNRVRNKRLADAEAFIGSMLEMLPFGVAVIDDKGILVYHNKSCGLFGDAVPTSPNGKHFSDVHNAFRDTMPERASSIYEGIHSVLEGSRPNLDIEFVSEMNKGKWNRLRIHRLEYGGSPRVLLIQEDITQPKTTENALKRSERRLRRLTDNMIDVVVELDAAYTITYLSPSFAFVSGCDCEKMLGRSAMDLLHHDDADKIDSILRDALITNSVLKEEARIVDSYGFYKWTEVAGKCVLDEKGEFECFILSARDIDDRKRMEDEIRYLSFHDKLTGLYNRAYFEDELHRMDTGKWLPLSVIIGDVNSLKLANDAFGHEEGDKLLVRIAELLRTKCRSRDLIARWGGDEFAILLLETDCAAALDICSNITAACEQLESNPVKPSIALGTATKYDSSQDISDIIRDAESWMYKHKLVESKSTRSSAISSLRKTLAEKTIETDEHVNRTKDVALQLARALGLSETQLDELALLAMLHDIGKVAVPENILNKPSDLTPQEWDIIKKHSEIGCRIAQASRELAHIADGILAYHERWDGSGYPQGLKGTAIPFNARVISIADAFDVMTHDRVYRKAITKSEALKEIRRCAGSQFDPDLVDTFVDQMNKVSYELVTV